MMRLLGLPLMLILLAVAYCGCGDHAPDASRGEVLGKASDLVRAGIAPSSALSSTQQRALREAYQDVWKGDIVADLDYVARLMKRTLEELPVEQERSYERQGQWAAFKMGLDDVLRMLGKEEYKAAWDHVELLKNTQQDVLRDR